MGVQTNLIASWRTSLRIFFVVPMLIHVTMDMSRVPVFPLLRNLALRVKTHQVHEFGKEWFVWETWCGTRTGQPKEKKSTTDSKSEQQPKI